MVPLLNVKLPYQPVCSSVNQSVGWPVCHNFMSVVISLPCYSNHLVCIYNSSYYTKLYNYYTITIVHQKVSQMFNCFHLLFPSASKFQYFMMQKHFSNQPLLPSLPHIHTKKNHPRSLLMSHLAWVPHPDVFLDCHITFNQSLIGGQTTPFHLRVLLLSERLF